MERGATRGEQGDWREVHGRRWMNVKGRNHGGSLFVDNLPKEMDHIWLRQSVGRDERIRDVYVSRKVRQNNPLRFGFVKTNSWGVRQAIITKLNGMRTRGNYISVSWAKFHRTGSTGITGPCQRSTSQAGRTTHDGKHLGSLSQAWRSGHEGFKESNNPNRTYKEVLEGNNRHEKDHIDMVAREPIEDHNYMNYILIEGVDVTESYDWLHKSIVAISSQPIDINGLKDWFAQHNILKSKVEVRSLGRFKCIITMETNEESMKLLNMEPKTIHPEFMNS